MKNIVGAADEKFDPKLTENSGESVDFKEDNAVVENKPLHLNKEAFAFLELLSKFNYEGAKITEKKLAVENERILNIGVPDGQS